MGKTRGLVCLFLALAAVGVRAQDSLTEWIHLQEQITRAVANVRDQYQQESLRLGLGWWGNVSRLGPRCDDVAYRMEQSLQQSFRKVKLRHYGIFLLFDSGVLPKDLMAHVYFGVVSKKTGRVLYCFDPWRYGDGRLKETCPNTPEQRVAIVD